ncbi:MAG: very short patch repair endonuclease [Deltaproteobacteria bacterium HGW-Deltaproteobacteria-15]|jgi:DNA mismatch endonuclease (patch repair protein)|nr:MAG: very short patch repair endonuclease [Deltaproteobacteria bacterium HGW-Deltaproteobacteria-15]
MDTVDKKTRSRIMASVGQHDTGPEMRLRRVLHKLGLRYRLNDRRLPGSPDLVFPRFHAAVFVHGCFWHAHEGCKFATKPSTRKGFWNEKFEANKRRDRRNYDTLFEEGWRVLVVWECSIKCLKDKELDDLGAEVAKWLADKERFAEIGTLVKVIRSSLPISRIEPTRHREE